MNPSVRSATTDDIPGIQRVADAAWRASYGDFLAERVIETILDD